MLAASKPRAWQQPLELLLHTLPILLLFYVQREVLFWIGQLPLKSYSQPVLTFEVLSNWRRLVAFAVFGLVLYSRRSQLNWEDDAFERRAKWLVFGVAAVLTWKTATLEYNYYFDQAYAVDRILLTLLCAAILWKPGFIVPYLVLFFAMGRQLHYPLGGETWIDRRPLFEVLILAVSVWLIPKSERYPRAKMFLFVALVLVGSTMVAATDTKLLIGWPWRNEPLWLAASAYANGWLGWIPEASMLNGLSRSRPLEPLMAWGTILLEGAGIVILYRYRLALVVLSGFVALHLIIFCISGILFLEWMLLELFLIVALSRGRAEWMPPHAFAASIVLIAASPIWLRPDSFAWFDSPLNRYVVMEGISKSGNVYTIPRDLFKPYDLMFSQSNFPYLSHEPAVVGTYGTVRNFAAYQAILNAGPDPQSLMAVKSMYGVVRWKPDRADRFHTFVRRWLQTRKRHDHGPSPFDSISFPNHISLYTPRAFTGQEDLIEVRLVMVEKYITRDSVVEISRKEVGVIPLQQVQSPEGKYGS